MVDELELRSDEILVVDDHNDIAHDAGQVGREGDTGKRGSIDDDCVVWRADQGPEFPGRASGDDPGEQVRRHAGGEDREPVAERRIERDWAGGPLDADFLGQDVAESRATLGALEQQRVKPRRTKSASTASTRHPRRASAADTSAAKVVFPQAGVAEVKTTGGCSGIGSTVAREAERNRNDSAAPEIGSVKIGKGESIFSACRRGTSPSSGASKSSAGSWRSVNRRRLRART